MSAGNRLVLIVDGEPDLVASLQSAFAREHYETCIARTGKDGIDRAFAEPRPDLVLLDVDLPDMSGIAVCCRLRADPRTRRLPIIMMRTQAGDVDRIVGLEVGADDYVTMPFSMRELLLRTRAVLRRPWAEPPTSRAARITIGDLEVLPDAHRVWIEDREVELTALEFRLLMAFVTHPERAYTREALLSEVWGMDADVTTRTVDMHILRLRTKLGAGEKNIETVRRVGYRLAKSAGRHRPKR